MAKHHSSRFAERYRFAQERIIHREASNAMVGLISSHVETWRYIKDEEDELDSSAMWGMIAVANFIPNARRVMEQDEAQELSRTVHDHLGTMLRYAINHSGWTDDIKIANIEEITKSMRRLQRVMNGIVLLAKENQPL